MSERVELEGYIINLRTATDAVGIENVTCVELAGVPTASGAGDALHKLFGTNTHGVKRLRITVEEIR
jgi:hypothetical protein